MPDRTHVLVVGNDSRQRDFLHDMLSESDYAVIAASNCDEAVRRTSRHQPGVALVDLWMSDVPGHLAIHAIRRADANTECIGIMSHAAQQNVAEEALRLGAFTVLRRPFDRSLLLNTVQRALERRSTLASLNAVKERLTILFDSLPVGVLIVEKRTRVVVDANPAAARIMAVAKSEIVGSLCHRRELNEDRDPMDTPVLQQHADSARTVARLPATTTAATISLNGREHSVECFVDVSGRLHVEAELDQCRALAELLHGDCDDILAVVDADGRTTTTAHLPHRLRNRAVPDPELAGWLPGEHRPRFRDALRTALETGDTQSYSQGQPPLDAWAVSIVPVQSADGCDHAAVRLRDLGEQDWSTLQTAARKLAADEVSQLVLTLDASGHVTDVNATACKRLEYVRSELIGVSFDAIDHPEDPQTWARTWSQLATRRRLSFESTFRTRNGEQIPMQVHLSLVHVGDLPLCIAIAEDVSSRQALDTALADAETRQRALLNGIDACALLLARDGRILAGNRKAADRLHATDDQLVGTRYTDHLSDTIASRRAARIEEAFMRKRPLSYRDMHAGFSEEHTLTPVPGTSGGSSELVLITRDVTDTQSRDGTLHAVWDRSPHPLLELNLQRIKELYLADADDLGANPEATLRESSEAAEAVCGALRFTAANTAGLEFLGFDDPDALVRHGADCFRGSIPQVGALIGRLVRGDKEVRGEIAVVPRGDTEPHRVTLCLVPNPLLEGALHQVTAMIIDDEALRRVQRQLSQVSARERQRVGSDVGNTLGPLIEHARRLLHADDATGAANALDEAADALRVLGAGLERGTELGTSLIAALQELSAQTQRAHGITCRCNISAKGLGQDRALATHLYMVAREAVDAAVRRHGARDVSIALKPSRGSFSLTIIDDGHAPPATDEADIAEALLHVHADCIGAACSRNRANDRNILTCTFEHA